MPLSLRPCMGDTLVDCHVMLCCVCCSESCRSQQHKLLAGAALVVAASCFLTGVGW